MMEGLISMNWSSSWEPTNLSGIFSAHWGAQRT